MAQVPFLVMKTKPLKFLSIKAAQRHPAAISFWPKPYLYMLLTAEIWLNHVYESECNPCLTYMMQKHMQSRWQVVLKLKTMGDISMVTINKHSLFVKFPLYLQPKTNISPEKICLEDDSFPFKMVSFLRGHSFILRGSCTFPKMLFSSDLLTTQMEVTKKGSLGRVAGTCLFSQYTRED